MHWNPQAPLTAFQACRRHFHFRFVTTHFLSKVFLCVIICQYSGFCLFLNTSNRRGKQFHTEQCSNIVLSADLNPIGDQNDAQ